MTGRTKQVLPAPHTLCASDETHFNELHVKVPDKSLYFLLGWNFTCHLSFFITSQLAE